MRYGLLGRSLTHSFSPAIHHAIGDYAYELFERDENSLPAFFQEDWQGINVTIPYKETVMPYCSIIDDKAQRIGCVNTLVRDPDKGLIGYNTDYDGFAFALTNANIDIKNRKCLILGNGATSKTIRTVLTDMGAREILNIGRHDAIPYSDIHLHHDAEVIINATPVGMYPKTPARLISLDGFSQLEAVFDVIYNPQRSQLLLDAQALGVKTCNGLPMLVAQAVYAAQYFIGLTNVSEHILPILQQMNEAAENIVLIGMPGVGKTTLGRSLAQATGRTFVDIDDEIATQYGDVATYINTHGINAFRTIETKTLAQFGREHGLIIATGGGCVTRPENEALLRQNGRIYWLERPLAVLPTHGRPLSQGGLKTLQSLYQERHPLYQQFSDQRFENNQIESTTLKIMEDFHEAMHY